MGVSLGPCKDATVSRCDFLTLKDMVKVFIQTVAAWTAIVNAAVNARAVVHGRKDVPFKFKDSEMFVRRKFGASSRSAYSATA